MTYIGENGRKQDWEIAGDPRYTTRYIKRKIPLPIRNLLTELGHPGTEDEQINFLIPKINAFVEKYGVEE